MDDTREKVLDAAGKALARRALSRAALAARLADVASPEVCQAVLDDLERLGYVDDEALALSLAEQRLASGWGPGRVEADLERLAVGEAAARVGVRAAEAGEEEAARALLASRAAAGRTPAQRLGLLARRGFTADAAESVLGVFDVSLSDSGCRRGAAASRGRRSRASRAARRRRRRRSRRSSCRRAGRRARLSPASRPRRPSPR